MTPSPRLAPLETMTTNDLKLGVSWNQLRAEVEAQRLARARERVVALNEAIATLEAMYHEPIDCGVVSDAIKRLKALRDQEEA